MPEYCSQVYERRSEVTIRQEIPSTRPKTGFDEHGSASEECVQKIPEKKP